MSTLTVHRQEESAAPSDEEPWHCVCHCTNYEVAYCGFTAWQSADVIDARPGDESSDCPVCLLLWNLRMSCGCDCEECCGDPA